MSSSSGRVIPLRDCLAGLLDNRGKSPLTAETGIPIISAAHVKDGYVDHAIPFTYFREDAFEQWTRGSDLNTNDILFTTEAPLGNAAHVPTGRFAVAQRVVALRPNDEVVSSEYLLQYLRSPRCRLALARLASGSTAKGVKQSELLQLPVVVPDVHLQNAIAAFGAVSDRLIQGLAALIRLKDRRRRALTEILLGRAHGQQCRFDALFDESRETKGVRNIGNVITVGKYAIRRQEEHFTRSVASADRSQYLVIQKGDFVYDPMSAYYGAIGRYELDEPGIVSPAYRVLRLVSNVSSDYIKHLLGGATVQKELRRRSSQGNKTGKRRTLQRSAFASITVRLPSLEEQNQVGQALTLLGREVVLLGSERQLLADQKRSVIETLLSSVVERVRQ